MKMRKRDDCKTDDQTDTKERKMKEPVCVLSTFCFCCFLFFCFCFINSNQKENFSTKPFVPGLRGGFHMV